jgi:hypothetical protein
MRKAVLQRLAAEAAAGADSPVARRACAPHTSTPDTLPAGGQNPGIAFESPTPLGEIGGVRTTGDTTSAAARVEDATYNLEQTRYNHHSTVDNEALLVAEPSSARHADSSAGTSTQPEAASAQPTWPDEPELLQLGVEMLTGGTGAPAAPSRTFEYAKADHELLTRS